MDNIYLLVIIFIYWNLLFIIMSNAKETVESLLQRLPKNISYDDIIEQIHIQQSIDEGLTQLDQGDVVSHEQVKEWMRKWLR